MAVDFFLKLDGIQGESQNEKFKNQIQLLSWNWGAANVSSVSGTGGSGAGKADLTDFNFMTYFDKSTPKFFKNLTEGTHIKTGSMSAVKSGAKGAPYLTVNFQEIFITSVQISGAGENPSVSISFTYNEMKIEYKEQDNAGNLTSTGAVTYNLKENKTS
jgi:type VI secretion system secreted protein Hcp